MSLVCFAKYSIAIASCFYLNTAKDNCWLLNSAGNSIMNTIVVSIDS